jgi:16S rRNA (guanine527-N7)-methyltransferase
MSAPESFLEALKVEQLELSARQIRLLDLFVGRLLETNRHINLTAVRDLEKAWHRHVLESLALARLCTGAARIADLGSGGGLPGVPLAILLPGARFTLIESTGKKARFIEETAAAAGLANLDVYPGRAEDAGRSAELRGGFDAVVSRAVGGLPELVELGLPLLRAGGRLIAVKGAAADAEVRGARRALRELRGEVTGVLPLLMNPAGEGRAVVVTKREATPAKYPRRAGIPGKRPLA